MGVNIRALEARAQDSPARARYAEMAALVTGRAGATAEEGLAWVCDLVAALRIPGLARFGLTPGDVATLVTRAQAANSMKGNPITLTEAELTAILTRAL